MLYDNDKSVKIYKNGVQVSPADMIREREERAKEALKRDNNHLELDMVRG